MSKKWQKAFTIEVQRVEEFVELYKEIGYEVKVGRARVECKECFDENYRTIYIKKKS